MTWIDAQEEVPDDERRVLLFVFSPRSQDVVEQIVIGYYCHVRDDWRTTDFEYCRGMASFDAIAWKDLPPPPNVEKQDDVDLIFED